MNFLMEQINDAVSTLEEATINEAKLKEKLKEWLDPLCFDIIETPQFQITLSKKYMDEFKQDIINTINNP
jgi:hypothetical protein